MVAGFKNGKLVSISVGLIRLLGGALACLIMDKAGRRIPLLTMAIGMCISLLLLGFYFEIYIPPPDSSSSSNTVSLLGSISHSIPASKINWLSIVCVILFNLFFCLAWGPVPWLVMSELFPMRARGPAVCMTAMANWLFIFIVTKLYDPMQSSISIQGTFWFYGGCMFLAFVFVYKLVPETKGKTLEEIESLFKPHKNSYMPIGWEIWQMPWCDLVARVLSYSSSIRKGEGERTMGTRLISPGGLFSRQYISSHWHLE